MLRSFPFWADVGCLTVLCTSYANEDTKTLEQYTVGLLVSSTPCPEKRVYSFLCITLTNLDTAS